MQFSATYASFVVKVADMLRSACEGLFIRDCGMSPVDCSLPSGLQPRCDRSCSCYAAVATTYFLINKLRPYCYIQLKAVQLNFWYVGPHMTMGLVRPATIAPRLQELPYVRRVDDTELGYHFTSLTGHHSKLNFVHLHNPLTHLPHVAFAAAVFALAVSSNYI